MVKLFCSTLVSALLLGSAAGAMTYSQVPFQDGSVALMAQGKIELDELERFTYAMQVAKVQGAAPRSLILASPGGNVVGAVKLGAALRQSGMRTTVGKLAHASDGQRSLAAADCASACVFVFMAGIDRTVLPGSRVGVHSPSLSIDVDEATRQAALARIEPLLRKYATAMGVSEDVIRASFAVPHTSIRVLSSADLSRYQLVTGGRGNRVASKTAAKRSASSRRKRPAA